MRCILRMWSASADLAAQWQTARRRFPRRASSRASASRSRRTASTTCPAASSLAISIRRHRRSCFGRWRRRTQFPREWIDATFERYWQRVHAPPRHSPPTWEAYTPYELRHVGTFVRLGRKDRAWEVLELVLRTPAPGGLAALGRGRSPRSEDAADDRRHAAHLVRIGFPQRRPRDVRLRGLGRAAAGAVRRRCPMRGSSIRPASRSRDLRTEFGGLSASVKPDGADHLVVRIDGTAQSARRVRAVFPAASARSAAARINGREVIVDARNRIEIDALPVAVDLEYEPN